MPRARKSPLVNDGMNLLQVMPFPAFNPWNWWALTAPRNAALAARSGAQAAVQAWRCSADALRTTLRAQQDAIVTALSATLVESEPASAPEDGAVEAEGEERQAESAAFVAPMLAATRAYSTMGKAFIIAQRDTLRAFSGAGKPH